MGNTIPHGDRLHECDATCREYEGKMTKINFTHENGRSCILNPNKSDWVIWRSELRMRLQGNVEMICLLDHPAEQVDPGEFGMPGVGIRHSPPPGLLDSDLLTHPPSPPVITSPAGGTVETDPGTWMGISPNRVWSISDVPGVTTALARRVVDKHLPEALDHFLMRNAEYGDDDDFNLGVAGQYVDISRKVQKLKRRWWDDEHGVGNQESDKVIVMELIGHLLMAMDLLESWDGTHTQDMG